MLDIFKKKEQFFSQLKFLRILKFLVYFNNQNSINYIKILDMEY